MRFLEVIPIAKGITKESLSYFTATDVSIGSIIKVPLRKKIVSALVVLSRGVIDSKSEIKNSSFALKKIEKVKSFELLRKEFIETASLIADYYAGSTGAVLSLIVPKVLFEIADKLKLLKNSIKNTPVKAAEKFVIQSNDEDRYANYKSIIREEFAKGSSVFFSLPTIQDIKKAAENLQKGIEQYTFILHSAITKKEISKIIKKILEEKHPVLIIATGRFLSIPKNDIGMIIVDKENSRSYKIQQRPYVDIRNFAEIYAQKINAKIIFGDLLLRAETIYRYKKGEFLEIVPLKFRSLTTSSATVIDMRDNASAGLLEGKKEFKILSQDLERKIRENVERSERMFLFSGRRGLSPTTVCADCENIVKCNSCGAHMVLHKSDKENFFLCHKCGERRSSEEKCGKCGGWRLTTLGIGAELVEEKIRETYPNIKIYRIDSDRTPTHKKALSTAESFYNSPGSILIGTEMALLYLTEKIENSAVVSIDSFFSIPDFRINERILNILLKMRAMTDKNMIIQTRDVKQKIFDYAVRGNLIDFFKDEIDDRRALGYPPFSTLIKISVIGSKNQIAELVENLHKTIEPYTIDIFPAFIPQAKGKFGINGVTKIPEGKWPDNGLSNKLKNLTINYIVNIDPDSLI